MGEFYHFMVLRKWNRGDNPSDKDVSCINQWYRVDTIMSPDVTKEEYFAISATKGNPKPLTEKEVKTVYRNARGVKMGDKCFYRVFGGSKEGRFKANNNGKP